MWVIDNAGKTPGWGLRRTRNASQRTACIHINNNKCTYDKFKTA